MGKCDFCHYPGETKLGQFTVCRPCVHGLIRGERPLTMPRSAFKQMRQRIAMLKSQSGIRLALGREHRISGRW